MGYIVLHFNGNSSGGIATDTKVYTVLNDAEYKYHQWLSQAAQSNNPYDGVIMMTNEGEYIKKECFYHETEPIEPEPEPEPEPEGE